MLSHAELIARFRAYFHAGADREDVVQALAGLPDPLSLIDAQSALAAYEAGEPAPGPSMEVAGVFVGGDLPPVPPERYAWVETDEAVLRLQVRADGVTRSVDMLDDSAAAVQLAALAQVQADHVMATMGVHGIADTSRLITQDNIATYAPPPDYSLPIMLPGGGGGGLQPTTNADTAYLRSSTGAPRLRSGNVEGSLVSLVDFKMGASNDFYARSGATDQVKVGRVGPLNEGGVTLGLTGPTVYGSGGDTRFTGPAFAGGSVIGWRSNSGRESQLGAAGPGAGAGVIFGLDTHVYKKGTNQVAFGFGTSTVTEKASIETVGSFGAAFYMGQDSRVDIWGGRAKFGGAATANDRAYVRSDQGITLAAALPVIVGDGTYATPDATVPRMVINAAPTQAQAVPMERWVGPGGTAKLEVLAGTGNAPQLLWTPDAGGGGVGRIRREWPGDFIIDDGAGGGRGLKATGSIGGAGLSADLDIKAFGAKWKLGYSPVATANGALQVGPSADSFDVELRRGGVGEFEVGGVGAATDSRVVVKMLAGQSGDAFRVVDNLSSVKASISPTGAIYGGDGVLAGTGTFKGRLTARAKASSEIPIVAWGWPGQTQDLFQAQDDAGGVRTRISAVGGLISSRTAFTGGGWTGMGVPDTGNVFEARQSGAVRFYIGQFGGVYGGYSGAIPGAAAANAFANVLGPTSAAFVAQGIASQTGDLIQGRDDLGAVKGKMAADGSIGTPAITTPTGTFGLLRFDEPSVEVLARASAINRTPLVSRGAVGQTQPLIRGETSSAATEVFNVTPSGVVNAWSDINSRGAVIALNGNANAMQMGWTSVGGLGAGIQFGAETQLRRSIAGEIELSASVAAAGSARQKIKNTHTAGFADMYVFNAENNWAGFSIAGAGASGSEGGIPYAGLARLSSNMTMRIGTDAAAKPLIFKTNVAERARLDDTGDLTFAGAGAGPVLVSPDGLLKRRVSINNAGAITLTAV